MSAEESSFTPESNPGESVVETSPGAAPVTKVRKLREGTVLDHLTSGSAFDAFRALGLNHEKGVVLIGMNLQSKKAKTKDIIKIEHRELTRDEINRIALTSPDATISIIRDFEVADKFRVEIPDVIEGVVRCQNPNCITNVQDVRSRFTVLKRKPITLRCAYCERRVKQEDLDFII